MATKPYPIRLDDKTRDRWEAAAASDGIPLATFVREAVEDRIGAAPAAKPRSKAAKAQRATAKTQTACPRARHHRSGTFCKSCGTIPA